MKMCKVNYLEWISGSLMIRTTRTLPLPLPHPLPTHTPHPTPYFVYNSFSLWFVGYFNILLKSLDARKSNLCFLSYLSIDKILPSTHFLSKTLPISYQNLTYHRVMKFNIRKAVPFELLVIAGTWCVLFYWASNPMSTHGSCYQCHHQSNPGSSC